MTYKAVFILSVGSLWSIQCYSHHNAASHYQLDRTATVSGVVTEFWLINPHARIYFDVKSATGKTEKWLAEGNAAGVLKRRGWTSDSLKPGDAIQITGRPARDGGNKLDWEIIRFDDGRVLRGGNTVGGERERQLDELEALRRERQQTENEEPDQ
jgi:hypothetical protein